MERADRYSRWQDAMVAQTRVLDWSLTSLGTRWLTEFFKDMNTKRPGAALDPDVLARIQVATLHGEPTYVSMNACDVIEQALPTFNPEAVLPSDPWVPNGFALLAKPIYMPDAPPSDEHPFRSPTGLIPVRAIGWQSIHNDDLSQGCFWISYYVDVDDELDHCADQGVEDKWGAAADEMRRIMPLSLVHQWQWTWGRSVSDPGYQVALTDTENVDEVRVRAFAQAALVQTMWRIGSQLIPVREQPHRAVWREANRKGIEGKHINVIRLRRASNPREHEDPSGRHYKVQFPVGGYWAIRHKREGPRQVWVMGHWKGPEDAPVQVSDRVWEFVR